MARTILAATDDGSEMVEFALRVWRDPARPHRERWAAVEWLADRALGKAPQVVDLDADVDIGPLEHLDLTKLTDEELTALISGLSTALAPTEVARLPPAPPPPVATQEPARSPHEPSPASQQPEQPELTAPRTPEEWRAHAARLAYRDGKPR